MNDFAVRASRPANRLGRAFLTLCAAAILAALSLLDARAAVNMLKFAAVWQKDGTILVAWETSSELDSVAFFLYRSESQNGPWDDYIDFEPAEGNDFTGATYSFVDHEVTQGVTYWYRLEELAADNSSSFHGPITPSDSTSSATATATATRAATTRPTATERPGQSSNPTATRQYTNTPAPAGAGTSSPAQNQSPARFGGTVQPASTRSSGLMVTTPTPVGGVPAAEAPSPTPEVTDTPSGGQPEPAVAETPVLQPTQPAPTPSPTVQQIAAAPKETSQPLLDASATQSTAAPSTEAPPTNGANSRLALLLGFGALAAAVLLGGIALLIWRGRSR
jgi:hypothetical protein